MEAFALTITYEGESTVMNVEATIIGAVMRLGAIIVLVNPDLWSSVLGLMPLILDTVNAVMLPLTPEIIFV